MPNRKKGSTDLEQNILAATGQVVAGAFLKALRNDRGLSLTTLGEFLEVSAHYLSEVERGTKRMSDDFVRKISDFYEIDESELFAKLNRVALLAREQLEEMERLQNLLIDIKTNPKLNDCQKEELVERMYRVYHDFLK